MFRGIEWAKLQSFLTSYLNIPLALFYAISVSNNIIVDAVFMQRE